DKLGRLLHGDNAAAVVVNSDTVGAIGAWDWGPMLVARHLWRELGVEMTLDKLSARERGDAVRLSDRALVLVTNRLTAPGSEHALARWLESEFVCDRIGRRFIPAWRMTTNARRVERRECVSRCVSSSNGIARSINYSPARPRSSTGSLCSCAISSRCRS